LGLNAGHVEDGRREPVRLRRGGSRAGGVAWAIAAGVLLLAPEAAAGMRDGGEVAPPDEADTRGEREVASPDEADTRSEGEVAPPDELASPGEEAPRGEADARDGSEAAPPSGADTRDGSEAAPPSEADTRAGDGVAPHVEAVPPGNEVAPPVETQSPASRRKREVVSTPEEPSGGRLSQYLQRPVRYGAHYLDHGVLQPAIAGGWPHGYRLELSLGLLDHFTIGATTHWLPGQPKPKVSPVIAIAVIRSRLFEVGVWHFWSLFPPPVDDVDTKTPSYQRSAQWFLATASFGQAWLTGGLDAGVVRARVNDPSQDPMPDTSNASVIRWRFGGGLHLRAGTRRWGFTAQVLVPQVLAELRFDVRFGLFEKRSKGGWKVYGMAEDWDRGAPW
jgi:hypothetical protein